MLNRSMRTLDLRSGHNTTNQLLQSPVSYLTLQMLDLKARTMGMQDQVQ